MNAVSKALLGAALLSIACLGPVAAQGVATNAPAPATTGPTTFIMKNMAAGFTGVASTDKIVLMPVDVELFSLSAGGVGEPKADWTQAAQGFMKSAIAAKKAQLKISAVEMSEA